MKRNILKNSTASLTVVLAVCCGNAFSQPNRWQNRPPQRQGSYQNQWQQPASPYIIMNADGRSSGYNGRNFDACIEQRNLSRKQKRNLEKRYGFVPPLVMYVPDRYITHTPRGDFYRYTNGLVYQKQRDGYYHLDDRYFNDDRDDWDSRNDRGNWNNNGRGNWNN